MRKTWKVNNLNGKNIDSFVKHLGIHHLTAGILINRGINTVREADSFLNLSLSDLHDPFLMKDMGKAVNRIKKALHRNEKIMLHGDYDVDGITGLALLMKYLKQRGAHLMWHIPNRLKEGYGLGKTGVALAKKEKVSLLITVDCGTLALQPIQELKSCGIDVIVTDHHHPDNKLPPALAILNPVKDKDTYPFKGLSGVGVAFKLCQALHKTIDHTGTDTDIFDYIYLVALGTVCDVSSMKGENRILVKYGLESLNKYDNVGIDALAKVARFSKKNIQTGHIGFILGPRLNASGRLGMAGKSLQLLLAEDMKEAEHIAKFLDTNNKNRQEIQNRTLKEAEQQIEETVDFSSNKVLVLYGAHWHQGVIGIVASKLADKYYRPVIMLCGDSEILQGSGRSIPGFHLYEAVSKCREYLISFGGHQMACGITIDKENIPEFRNEINRIANFYLNADKLIPHITIDSEIELSSINKKMLKELEKLAPFGPENPKPVFCSFNLKLRNQPEYLKKNGLKLWVTDGNLTYKAISFEKEILDKIRRYKKRLHLAYSPYIEEYRGQEEISFKIKDIKL